uniref:CSON004400 protein n=1 Tax=Culicoides sonorensis TaxID=179676 RepID=A0A336LTP3_CULSO
MSADNEDPCRICWKPIIGKGFDIDTKPAHMTLTFSQIYSYISGFKPKNGSKVLCWGCSKDFIHAYKLTKQVEEKEKILSGEVPKIEKRKISKKRSFDESPTYETQNYDPPVQNLDFEMIVVKPEPISDSEGEYGSVDYGGNEFQNFSENEFEPENSNELSEPALLRPLVVIEDIKKELNDEGSSNDEKVKPKQETPIFVSQHKRSIQCILCDFTSPTVESYRAHARKMHPNVKMKCDGCSFTHHYITTLETHRKEMHWYKHKYVLKLANENENETKNEQTDDGDEKPLIAKQEIKSEPPCEVPQPIVKMQTAHGKPLGRKKQGEIKWPRKSKKIPIKCPLCPYSTIGKDNFRNHYRNQHNKQELKCDGCDAKFHLFYRLNRHREEEHGFEHEYIVDESLKVQPKPPKESSGLLFGTKLIFSRVSSSSEPDREAGRESLFLLSFLAPSFKCARSINCSTLLELRVLRVALELLDDRPPDGTNSLSPSVPSSSGS